MKTEIAGLIISYTTVNELNEKMKKALDDVLKTLDKINVQHKNLIKQKKEISKFLGITKKRAKVEQQSVG